MRSLYGHVRRWPAGVLWRLGGVGLLGVLVALLVAVPSGASTGITIPGITALGITTPAVTIPIGLNTPPTTPAPTGGTAPYAPTPTPVTKSNPLAQRGMWIWQLDESSDGNLAAIIAEAKADGVKTLMIKSSDGTEMWPQFTPAVVAALHAGGLKVCAWQYVYGNHPLGEAAVGARAVRDGADCLLIDAESEYQGKYVAAQAYITRLRKLIGASFPVGLAGLPYVDFHPSFPYSVFLGPGAAQYNVPQMYWRAIGVTPNQVFAHTYEYNDIYDRPIFPLGQIYDKPPVRQVLRFRELSRLYGATNVSWWDYQSAAPQSTYFRAISEPVGTLHGVPADAPATIALHAEGDLVVWAQEHLLSAGRQLGIAEQDLPIDGDFGAGTYAAVVAFQQAKDLPVTGEIDPPTWLALLQYQPVTVRWVTRRKKAVAVAAPAVAAPAVAAPAVAAPAVAAPAVAAPRNGVITDVVPRSATLPARGRDIPAGLGAGGNGS
jgi:hypothetical protein